LRHKLLDYYRGRHAAPLNVGDDELAAPLIGKTAYRSRWPQMPDELLERKEFWQALSVCLGRLPEPVAQAFLMREVEGIEADEVCRLLEISPANLWTRLHRARAMLRDCLDQKWSRTAKPGQTKKKK
jgi:RNA polymerase sigma-70 factor (ECF subfamily)